MLNSVKAVIFCEMILCLLKLNHKTINLTCNYPQLIMVW